MVVKVEAFIRPFLRVIPNDKAEITFKVDGRVVKFSNMEHDIKRNTWVINFDSGER